MLNSYLSGQIQQEDHVIHLLFSANRWERAGMIKDLLNQGTSVVIDRYYYSGCVYSAAKQNPAMDLAWCRSPDVGLPRPDLCLFLDIAAEEAAKRGGFGAERYEKQEMQDRVRALFATLRSHSDEAEDITVIDAGRSAEEVEMSIQEAIDDMTKLVAGQTSELRYIRPWAIGSGLEHRRCRNDVSMIGTLWHKRKAIALRRAANHYAGPDTGHDEQCHDHRLDGCSIPAVPLHRSNEALGAGPSQRLPSPPEQYYED
nr:isoform 2 of thymidylate kinase [Quercus suber]